MFVDFSESFIFIYYFASQVDESSRQREEINSLLSQVCDLQKRVQSYSHENDDLTANLRVYQVIFHEDSNTYLTIIQLCDVSLPDTVSHD